MMYVELDDFRQSYVVAKNEIRKFVRGKRFTLYVALIGIVFALITFLPYLVGGDLGNTSGEVISNYVPYVFLLVILAATLFASITVVSEFEERTALILFTRPIKKTSIFLGKILGCIILETVMVVVFYIGIMVVAFAVSGSVSSDLLISLGLAFIYVVATSGVAVLISSIMKKGSTCAILTFVLLLLILPIISGVLSMSMDPWFMLDQAANSISTSMPEYVANTNDGMQALIDQLAGMGFEMDQDTIDSLLISAPDLVKSVGTMLGWGLITMILAWIAFIRREF